MTARCFFCEEAIDPDGATTWQATSCFTRCKRIRSSGRRRDMSDRVVYRYLDVFAHDGCVHKFRAGIPAGQAALL